VGVAPEAIVESFSSIGSNILSSRLSSFFIHAFDFFWCATSAPDESSPRGYKGCLQPFIDSNISFAQLFFFQTLINLPSPFVFSTILFSILFYGIIEAHNLV
jgi:hypothetical protein